MNTTEPTAVIADDEPHWISRSAFQIVIILFALTEAALFIVLYNGFSWWFAVPLVLIASHLMHGAAIGFHEASHGRLRENRAFNEFDGILVGTFSLIPFSLYRASHQTHHAYLASERDEELWPFVNPDSPRWLRVFVAIVELTFAMFFTPFLFYRSFLRKGSPIRSQRVRQRIWKETWLIVGVWTTMLAVVWYFDSWKYFLWMQFAPTFIAGNLQSWRKYIEHVGMSGNTANSATRSIVADDWLGRLVSFTLLHEPYHGLHHLHVGVPHAKLPGMAKDLEPVDPDDVKPFPSYTHALLDLLRKLRDPRVGSQWRRVAD